MKYQELKDLTSLKLRLYFFREMLAGLAFSIGLKVHPDYEELLDCMEIFVQQRRRKQELKKEGW